MREAAEASVTINDAEPAVVELLLSCIYTGMLESAVDKQAHALMPLAHR